MDLVTYAEPPYQGCGKVPRQDLLQMAYVVPRLVGNARAATCVRQETIARH